MGYKMIKDSQVTGLYRRSTANGEKWVVSCRVKGGNPTKVTLGLCSNLPAKEARTIAKQHLAAMAQGINPNTTRKQKLAKALTLAEAIEQYLREKRYLKPSTVMSYKSTLNNNFKGWMLRPINSITPQECVTRYFAIREEVAKRSTAVAKANPSGEAEAQKAMRTLGSVLQYFANDMLPDNTGRLLPFGNPVKGLADKGVRQQLAPRTSSLNFEQRIELLDFLTDPSHYYNADMTPKEENSRTPIKRDHADWIILLLCTGLRHDEPLKMKWDQVNFLDRTFTVINTKNSKPLTLPMTKRTERIFKERFDRLSTSSEFVFPQRNALNKPATMNRVPERIARMSGTPFTAHDLRRTTATSLSELGYSVEDIGRILNHSKKTVTERYIQTSVELMRNALEELETMLFDYDMDESEEDPSTIDWDELNNSITEII